MGKGCILTDTTFPFTNVRWKDIPHNTTNTHPNCMEYNFPGNTKDCNCTYMRTHTGPNHFRVYYKNAAYIRFTPKEVGRVFGIAKFTPSVNAMRDWCKEMVEKYELNSPESRSSGEAEPSDDTDTTTNTKMVI